MSVRVFVWFRGVAIVPRPLFSTFFFLRGKRIQIGSYAKARVYVRMSSYSSAYKMSEEDFEQPYYENHMN